MKGIKLYVRYQGHEYPIDMIDFVNERIAFRYIDDEIQQKGAHVDMKKYDVLLKVSQNKQTEDYKE